VDRQPDLGDSMENMPPWVNAGDHGEPSRGSAGRRPDEGTSRDAGRRRAMHVHGHMCLEPTLPLLPSCRRSSSFSNSSKNKYISLKASRAYGKSNRKSKRNRRRKFYFLDMVGSRGTEIEVRDRGDGCTTLQHES
jgi:hypothetical protein